jgi:hypothetical protein
MMSSNESDSGGIRVARIAALVCYILFLVFLALVTLHPAGGSWLASGTQAEMATATVPDGGDPAQLALRAKGIVGLE